MLVLRNAGLGDDAPDTTAVSPLDLSVNQLAGTFPPFLSQQFGPLPVWAWFGGADRGSRKVLRRLRNDRTS